MVEREDARGRWVCLVFSGCVTCWDDGGSASVGRSLWNAAAGGRGQERDGRGHRPRKTLERDAYVPCTPTTRTIGSGCLTPPDYVARSGWARG